MTDKDWMDRSYLDDLAAEGRDNRRHGERNYQTHALECRCYRCCKDEAEGEY